MTPNTIEKPLQPSEAPISSPGTQRQFDARGRCRHQVQAQRVTQCADDQHARGAELVGNEPGNRLRDAVEEVLDGDGGKAKASRPMPRSAVIGCKVQAEGMAHAQRNGQDHATAEEHDGGGTPVGGSHRGRAIKAEILADNPEASTGRADFSGKMRALRNQGVAQPGSTLGDRGFSCAWWFRFVD